MLSGRRWAATRVMSASPSSTRPAVGRSKPATMRSSVVLPHPDGPEHRHELALPERQADVVERHHRAEAVGDVLDGDGRRLLAHSGTTSATSSSPLAALRRAARRANRNATSQSTSVTVMSSVETTLIDGSTVRRSCDQM